MTIRTLEFIHRILEEEKNKQYEAYALMRDKASLAEEEEAKNAEYLKRQAEYAWNKQVEAARALKEFEEKEW